MDCYDPLGWSSTPASIATNDQIHILPNNTVYPQGLWKQPMSNLATQITNLLPKPVPSIHWTTVLESASDLTAKRLIQIRCQAPAKRLIQITAKRLIQIRCQAPLATRIAKTFAGGLRQMSTGRRGNPKQNNPNIFHSPPNSQCCVASRSTWE